MPLSCSTTRNGARSRSSFRASRLRASGRAGRLRFRLRRRGRNVVVEPLGGWMLGRLLVGGRELIVEVLGRDGSELAAVTAFALRRLLRRFRFLGHGSVLWSGFSSRI